MQYARLGRTGLRVSRIALGCMSFGDPTAGLHTWTLDEDASQPLFRQAVELGVTFWDTANVYQQGTSEEFVGRAMRRYSRREDVVLATKVFGKMHDGPGGQGLSRKAVLEQVDASLTRLGTDHIDLYLIHRFDQDVPVEETMEALHDVVKAGKVRYLGASSMFAWQFAKAQYTADLGGWTRFVSMQDHYNLMYREEEREVLPFCVDQGIGVLPWSPLARGRLTRDWEESTKRSGTDEFAATLYGEGDRAVVETLADVARRRDLPRAQVALAWLLAKPAVTSPIVGVTRSEHLRDAVAAVAVELSESEIEELEAPYRPHAVAGHS